MSKRLQNAKVTLRRILKYCTGALILAPVYRLCCLKPIKKGLVILADGHQNTIPYSMELLRARLQQIPELEVVEFFHDYSFCGMLQGLKIMVKFMTLYARAEYVFLCDSFVPTASCRKRKGTTVIQLWHSGGLMKKVGLDAPEDAVNMMKTQFRNTDVFTASSAVVSDVLSHALIIPRSVFSDAGVSRMDILFDEARNARLRTEFFKKYPQFRGKKIILWAPTFRGNVRNAYLVGSEIVQKLQKELRDDCAIIIKTHRFGDGQNLSTPIDFTSNELLPIADCLITDYSSIYFDYLAFRKPIILFAPDLRQYESNRGLYPDYRNMPGFVAENEEQLRQAILTMDTWADDGYHQQLDQLWEREMNDCDGHSTDKLLRQIGIIHD